MRYSATEDMGFYTEIESDDTVEQAVDRADERMRKAWDIVDKALSAHPELGVSISGRYDDDLTLYEDEICVHGCR